MRGILGIALLIISLFMTGITGYWFYLAAFHRARFHALMEEVTWPRISERAQYISAMILFPLMLIGLVLMIIAVVTP
jgi:hypothetical protein